MFASLARVVPALLFLYLAAYLDHIWGAIWELMIDSMVLWSIGTSY